MSVNSTAERFSLVNSTAARFSAPENRAAVEFMDKKWGGLRRESAGTLPPGNKKRPVGYVVPGAYGGVNADNGGAMFRKRCPLKRCTDVLVAAMKGDRVEIVVDTGNGSREYEVAATRAGRRVEITIGRGVVQVSEVTRSGTVVRTARFMASRVLSVVEHPYSLA